MIRWLFRQIFSLFALIFLVILCTSVYLVLDGLNDNNGYADVGVVLGNMVLPGGEPGGVLRLRLDKAVEAYELKKIPLIIVSGGSRGEDHYNEAASMSRYLQNRGIPASAIIEDPKGDNTAATAHNVAAILRKRKLHSILVLTSYYHITRAKLALRQNGFTNLQQLHSGFLRWQDAPHILRDTFAFYLYLAKYYLPFMQEKLEDIKDDVTHDLNQVIDKKH